MRRSRDAPLAEQGNQLHAQDSQRKGRTRLPIWRDPICFSYRREDDRRAKSALTLQRQNLADAPGQGVATPETTRRTRDLQSVCLFSEAVIWCAQLAATRVVARSPQWCSVRTARHASIIDQR
jgi:hypothetical protein